MSKKSLVLAPSLACLICLGAGAIPADFRLDFLKSQVAFEPAADPDAARSLPPDPASLFDGPLEALERARWLRVEMTHRTQIQGKLIDKFIESKIRVVRGPKGLFRHESETQLGNRFSRTLAVSDGMVVAFSKQFADRPPDVSGQRLPKENASQCADLMKQHGFDSPQALFQMIRKGLKDGKAEAGRWGSIEVFRVAGAIDVAKVGGNAPGTHCHVYFRRDDSWPFRVEWFEKTSRTTRTLAIIELTGLAVDVPLTEEQCKETFTFPRDGAPTRLAAKQTPTQAQGRTQ
ncbi:MAG: hypothetical protein K2X38_13660 [Gemmataceae bacterium]|nr:hypothetical protein [Gemmataceae bacterium]